MQCKSGLTTAARVVVGFGYKNALKCISDIMMHWLPPPPRFNHPDLGSNMKSYAYSMDSVHRALLGNFSKFTVFLVVLVSLLSIKKREGCSFSSLLLLHRGSLFAIYE